MSDCMIVDLLMIRTRIIWPNGTGIEKCADILRRANEVKSDAGPYTMASP
jgi:hypothetical protein